MRKGLEVIGICDHNSAENVPAVQKNGRELGITVIGGMEVTSKEEVHILALFDMEDKLLSLQGIVYDQLNGTNDERLYGEQVIVNENEEVEGFNRKLLIGATEITLARLIDLIHERDGLAIASHVDREGFGIIGQLGFIPPGLPLDALEIADPASRGSIPQSDVFPFVTFSDAHNLADVGKRHTCFSMESVSVEEMRRCLHREDGREVRI